MQRREFITLLGGTTTMWPLVARAQQRAMRIVGFLNSASPGPYPPLSAFLRGLNEMGFVEGRDVAIEYRWAEGHYERLPALIADLVQRKVSVIAATSTPAAVAAMAANTAIPTIFTTSGDPIQLGIVSSLSKPGGNLTGATQLNVEVSAKRLELMHEAIPTANNFALLVNPPGPNTKAESQDDSGAAAALGLTLHVLSASSEQDLDSVFESLAKLHIEALVIGSDPFFSRYMETIARLALRYRVPAIYQYAEFTTAGGLMSYGGNAAESYHIAGIYVGRILNGEIPANLPVQQVTKVELIINLKTAKALGLTVPPQIVARADQVIE
jgi:putative tryptophan/tyrosine transport system substrate-binding protein